MRNIKFKVWDYQSKKFIDCYGIDPLGKYVHVAVSDQCYAINEDGKPPEFELLQFTGFLDGKGEEIYDGDIILTETQFGINTILYCRYHEAHNCWVFKISNNESAFHYYYGEISKDITKIGNIFENSEYL